MGDPILYWVRRDFRLADNPALHEAAASGRPVVPVFILDEVAQSLGACPKWRLGLAAEAFATALGGLGARLIFRRGPALDVLRGLVRETGATTVLWGRAYDPEAIARDTKVKAGLAANGIDARSHSGSLLFEPWTVRTGAGGFYRVFTPYWKAVRVLEVPSAVPAPARLMAPDRWPGSEGLGDWRLEAEMNRGAEIVRQHLNVGEASARARLDAFMDGPVTGYAEARDFPGRSGTSRLSENLSLGEISPRLCWHAGRAAMEQGIGDAEIFLKELVWREFAYHLAYHTPHIVAENWREGWDAFPWNTDATRADVKAWQRGRTGIPFVDAAMRELYVTGHMHNRSRMIVASYLTKNLMTHWKIGRDWFADCLADWDPASNAMGWQWAAGSGPDAAPYFRVFNPVTQLEKFDGDHSYRNRWIAEGRSRPAAEALSYFDAVPRSWGLSPDRSYPEPVVTPQEGRARALHAYQNRTF